MGRGGRREGAGKRGGRQRRKGKQVGRGSAGGGVGRDRSGKWELENGS